MIVKGNAMVNTAILLREAKANWRKMASVIHGTNKPYKEDVAALFEHYAGKNVLSESGKA